MREQILKTMIITFGLSIYAHQTMANTSKIQSPVGYWVQYSDKVNKPQSVFEIKETQSGKLEGQILVPLFKLVDGKISPPDVICKKCGKGSDNGYSYDYTQAPAGRVQGLKLLWGFTKTDSQSSNEDGFKWDDGSLLDPESGHVYSGYLYTQKWGRELYVRGYWGISLIGRTQIWKRITRVEADNLVKQCGLVSNKTHYSYTDVNGKITNQKLWSSCSNLKL